MRKTIVGGVAVAAALALLSGTGVAASEGSGNTAAQTEQGGPLSINSVLLEVEQVVAELEAEANNAETEAANPQAEDAPEIEAPEQADNDADRVTAPKPEANEPEVETETETETESHDAMPAPRLRPAATPEPTESPEHHDGGGDSGSDH